MKTIEQKLKLLDETAKAYTSATRCTTAANSCKYYVEGKQGCAIGRLIEDKELCQRLDIIPYGGLASVTAVNNDWIFRQLPEDLQGYGPSLLGRLQSLHDCIGYWDNHGLSHLGTAAYNRIKDAIESGEV